MSAPHPAEATGRACGKAILIGEHFVLDGAEALAMPLADFWTEVRWRASAEPLTLQTDLPLSAAARQDALQMLAAAAIHAGARPLGRVAVRSTVPPHRGFGSSAAFAVAALRAARQFRDPLALTTAKSLDLRPLSNVRSTPFDLVGAARAVENVVHGSSSGLDPATAMGEGAVHFRDGQVLERVMPHSRLRAARWVLCDVGAAPPTGAAIDRANAARRAMGGRATAALVDRVAAATQGVISGLRDGVIGQIAAGITEAAACLRAIDVVDERMVAAMERSARAGGLASKQSGAGLGGAILTLAKTAAIAEIIAQQHRKAGLPTWILEVAS